MGRCLKAPRRIDGDLALMPDARRFLALQLMMCPLLATAASPFGARAAASIALGAVICLAASALAAALIFRPYRAGEPELLLLAIYWAEAIKLIVVLGSFALAFALPIAMSAPALIAGYLATQLAPAILAPLVGSRTNSET